MKQWVWLLLAVFSVSGCVSVEMPEHLVSDTANVAKDAYHAIVGDKSEPTVKGEGEGSATPATDASASPAPAAPAPAVSVSTPPQTGEYEYTYVGDEGISLKEAKATCFKNASVLARRASGKTLAEPRLVSEKAELDGDTIVVTCRIVGE